MKACSTMLLILATIVWFSGLSHGNDQIGPQDYTNSSKTANLFSSPTINTTTNLFQRKKTNKPVASPTSPSPAPGSDYVPNASTLSKLIICGYQGWFAFPGDGAPINKWKHWFSSDYDPSVSNLEVDMYPSMDEYDAADLLESNILMKDGSKAKFFSSARPNVVKKHFQWMRDYGISGVFQMRFMENMDLPKNREWKTMVLRNVKAAAESTGRVFAVSYNLAGNSIDDSVLDAIKLDWMDLVSNERITESGRYIRHNGLPVLRIFGVGFKTVNVTDTKKLAELIKWFKTDAEPQYRVFLIGGVPRRWRDLTDDSREEKDWKDIYQSFNGIHPWHVGSWGTTTGFQSFYNNVIVNDAKLCAKKGILYMPTMWPGFSWHNLNEGNAQVNQIPRLGGNFMWAQAYSYVQNKNINTIWMAQFDEVDEGTAIFKVAKNKQELPAEGNWLTLDADGVALPNDWYLKLCGEAQKMLLGKIALTNKIPINNK